ncbi:DUF6867 family protein [Azorhizobium sp. AG788]|uniref:DUF6867 family protein n=1 Tax=Azorhizobium sp. AG788 TaxID=2183897 RepID=UPI0031399D47
MVTPIPNPGRSSSPMIVFPAVALVAVLALYIARPQAVVEVSLGDFLLVTVALGGGAAWMAGRAVAKGWNPFLQVFIYAALVTCAVRFCHFALFNGTLFALDHFLLELVVLFAIATLGFRTVRKQQMTQRYGWIYENAGPFAWRMRRDGPASKA